ncbi:hypothetical protein MASR2M70_10860 [Bacillota bacterium]
MDMYEKIKQCRINLKMTQDDLAKKTGYESRSSIAKIEAGHVDLPQSKIVAFAQALNTSPAYLMGWIDDPMDEIYTPVTTRSISLDRMEELSRLYDKLQTVTDKSESEKISRRIKRLEKIRDKVFANDDVMTETSSTLPTIHSRQDQQMIDDFLNTMKKLNRDDQKTALKILDMFAESASKAEKPHLTPIAAHNDDNSQEQIDLMKEDLDDL